MPHRRHYLAIQTALPADYERNESFQRDLAVLQELRFDGVELNIADIDPIDPANLKAFLGKYGLTLSMFASGGAAKAQGLSLAATDEPERLRSVAKAREFLAFAAQFGAGVVAGFLKAPLAHNTPAHRAQLQRSIAELAPDALRLKTPLLIEAINRFESPLGHSLDDTYDLIGAAANPYLWILPDTWHMNIEESCMAGAMAKHLSHYGSFHLSDNNRFLPGFGALDFKQIVGVLDAIGYRGKLALEANFKHSLAEDVRVSMRYLEPILD